MSSISHDHRKVFGNIAAYVVVKKCNPVATIAFKYPRDGAGRLYAYVHWVGCDMVRGWADGYGYDKQTAACADASDKLRKKIITQLRKGTKFADPGSDADNFMNAIGAFMSALCTDDGETWNYHLRDAGFEVWQAV